MEFKVNPYGPYVAHKMVNELKMSHKEEDAVTLLAMKLGELDGSKTTIYRGKVHEYLGMDIDRMTKPGTMIVSVIKCLYKVIEKFPDIIKETRSSL